MIATFASGGPNRASHGTVDPHANSTRPRDCPMSPRTNIAVPAKRAEFVSRATKKGYASSAPSGVGMSLAVVTPRTPN